MNEAKQGSKQPKWGYASSRVGDALTLRVSRSRSAGALLGFGRGNSSVLVGLGVLRSYAGMGAASVACAQGCVCSPQVFELQHKQQVGDLRISTPRRPCLAEGCAYKAGTACELLGSCAASASQPVCLLV